MFEKEYLGFQIRALINRILKIVLLGNKVGDLNPFGNNLRK